MIRSRTLAIALGASVCAFLLASCVSEKKPKPNPATEATAHYRMAQALLKNGRMQDAVVEMEQATTLAPANADMANFKGQLLLLAGRYPLAEKELQRALTLDPYMTDAHNNLGAVFDRTGRKSEAEEQYRLALADPAFPTPEKVHLNLGLLYASEGRDEESLRELRKAVEIDPKYYQAHYELAGRLDALGKLEESAREYEVASADYRGSAEFQYRLGFVYFRLGDKVKAGEHLRKVIDLSPGSESASRADELLKTVR